jgi:hypothetical protein
MKLYDLIIIIIYEHWEKIKEKIGHSWDTGQDNYQFFFLHNDNILFYTVYVYFYLKRIGNIFFERYYCIIVYMNIGKNKLDAWGIENDIHMGDSIRVLSNFPIILTSSQCNVIFGHRRKNIKYHFTSGQHNI